MTLHNAANTLEKEKNRAVTQEDIARKGEDKTEINKVCRPVCGSGSLPLKAEKVLSRGAMIQGRRRFCGTKVSPMG